MNVSPTADTLDRWAKVVDRLAETGRRLSPRDVDDLRALCREIRTAWRDAIEREAKG